MPDRFYTMEDALTWISYCVMDLQRVQEKLGLALKLEGHPGHIAIYDEWRLTLTKTREEMLSFLKEQKGPLPL